jgi:4-carboxymuconolactone decarboxylase
MTDATAKSATPQGFHAPATERIPVPAPETLDDAQRAAADAIIAGPRKAIFGPFVPLLQCPALMERIGAVGETLRFQGRLSDVVRELVILVVARETSNQFEWQTHAPLARRAGAEQHAIDAIAQGRRPELADRAAQIATDFAAELIRRHGVSDATYAETEKVFGQSGVVELASLVGYFAMVCWVMNVARTPGPAGSTEPPLAGC